MFIGPWFWCSQSAHKYTAILYRALTPVLFWGMIFSENRLPLFSGSCPLVDLGVNRIAEKFVGEPFQPLGLPVHLGGETCYRK